MKKMSYWMLLLSVILSFVACGKENNKKVKITHTNGGSGASGLSKVDEKTSEQELPKLITSYSKELEKVKTKEQISSVIISKMNNDFSLLMNTETQILSEDKNTSSNKNDKNSAGRRTRKITSKVKPESFIKHFEIEEGNTDKGKKVDVVFEHKLFSGAIHMSEVFTKEQIQKGFYILNKKTDDKVNGFSVVYMPLTDESQIIIIKHYRNDKIQSISPFVRFRSSGKISVENSSKDILSIIGNFVYLDTVLNPLSKVTATQVHFVNKSYTTKIKEYSDSLPDKIDLIDDSFVNANLQIMKNNQKQAAKLRIEVADKQHVVHIEIESLFGLF